MPELIRNQGNGVISFSMSLNKTSLAVGDAAESEFMTLSDVGFSLKKASAQRDDCDIMLEGIKIEIKNDTKSKDTGNLAIEILQTAHRTGGQAQFSGITKSALYEKEFSAPIVEARRFWSEDKWIWILYRPSQVLNYFAKNRKNLESRIVDSKEDNEQWGNIIIIVRKANLFDLKLPGSILLDELTDLQYHRERFAALTKLAPANADVNKLNRLLSTVASKHPDMVLPVGFRSKF